MDYYDLHHTLAETSRELAKVTEERNFLAACVDALEGGGGRIHDLISAPGTKHLSGRPVKLWVEGVGWHPRPAQFAAKHGLFMENEHHVHLIETISRRALLWKPA